jgi:uncharacterized protein YceK
MKTRNLALSFLLAVSPFLNGCSTVNKITAPSLKGDPSASSVVVVKCESSWRGVLPMKTPQQPMQGILLSTDGKTSLAGHGMADLARRNDLIIFSDVPPGEYHLAMVQVSRQVQNQGTWVETYNIPGEDVTKYVFTAKTGEPKYLGVVTIDETQKLKRSVVFGLKPGKEAEIAAWEKFLSLYPGSSWANAAQKQISELKQ